MPEAQQYQLSAMDTMMLVMETEAAHSHVGGLVIVDPGDKKDYGHADVLALLEERIERVPRFLWRLEDPSLGLDRPYFVRDENFDLERHVKRIALPSPGGTRELCELIAYLHGIPLDRKRALWEMWVIEGLAEGRVAMYSKTHHCLMDGASGAGLAEVLCDLSADGSAALPAAPSSDPRNPKLPGAGDRWLRGLRNSFEMPGKLAGHVGQAIRGQLSRNKEKIEFDLLPFNAGITKERGFVTTRVSLADVKAVRKRYDVSVNDVVLALSCGGLRRMLDETGDLPSRPIAVAIPISTRAEGDESLGNQITNAPIPLPTQLANPVEALRRISRSMEKIKTDEDTRGFDMLGAMAESFIPALGRLFMLAAGGENVTDYLPANTTISNVRGAPMPLYSAGAKIECMVPVSMLAPGMGLNVTVMSYLDRIDFGIVYAPGLVPNPWTMCEGIDQTMKALLDSIEA